MCQTPLQGRMDEQTLHVVHVVCVHPFVRWRQDQQRTRHEQVVDVVQHFVYTSHKLAKNGEQSRRKIFTLTCSCVILCSVLLSHAIQLYLGEPRINAIPYLPALFIPKASYILRHASSLVSSVAINSVFHSFGSFWYTFIRFSFDNLSTTKIVLCINCVTDHMVEREVSIGHSYWMLHNMLYNLLVSNSTTRTSSTDERTNTYNTFPHPNISTCQDVGMWQNVRPLASWQHVVCVRPSVRGWCRVHPSM